MVEEKHPAPCVFARENRDKFAALAERTARLEAEMTALPNIERKLDTVIARSERSATVLEEIRKNGHNGGPGIWTVMYRMVIPLVAALVVMAGVLHWSQKQTTQVLLNRITQLENGRGIEQAWERLREQGRN